ncbi:phenoloxidase-activating factor 2-like [Anopheles aquasalis]|uniref:phenoloxidase-activating factor 2-like n=1 Tax=Anopheles aquasalis TaxID=42839 RepID=UPI00215A867A|nr:phenoloxidase-activating factor 2-like [Anopheles aquasalis]
MSLLRNFVVLCLLVNSYCQIDLQKIPCGNGFCVKKHLCEDEVDSTVRAPKDPYDLITLRIGDTDVCFDYMLVCCKKEKAAEEVTTPSSAEDIEVPPPSEVQCGKKNERGLVYDFQHNDTVAQFGQYPWMVSVRKTQGGTSEYLCGGALTHPTIVITTAHNVHGRLNLIARLGEWDVSTSNEPLPHKDVAVADIFIHKSYKPRPIENDIAILVLSDPVTYDQHIRPICLPQSTDRFEGQRCESTGWGTVGGVYSNIMKMITVPVLPQSRCSSLLGQAGLGEHFALPNQFLCAGGEKNVDMCNGDGGSPLVCPTADGSYKLAGIVSWGIGCGGLDIPGVYTSVSNYVSWIEEMIENLD